MCLLITLEHVKTQQELTSMLVLIMRELQKGKVLWKEFFKQKIEFHVKKNVKFDKDMDERVGRVYELLNRDNFNVFQKKLEAFRD